jgi:hypothetical protein
MKTHLLIPFIIISALSVAATLEAGSPTSSPGEVTLQNSPDEEVKLVGVEFGHDQIFVTLQNTGDKDIAELSVSVHFSDSRGPYMWTGSPEGLFIHSLGAHSVIKIGLSKPDMSDDKEDFNKLLKMKKSMSLHLSLCRNSCLKTIPLATTPNEA